MNKKQIHFGSLIGSAIVTILILLSSPVSAMVVFSDNFNAGASVAWGNESGNWRDTDGVYDATNPDNNPITFNSITTLTGLTNFAVDVDVNSVDDGGIWLRSNYNGGNINGVLLVTGGFTGSNDGMYWHIVQNGVIAPLMNNVQLPGLQGTNVNLHIEVIGDLYQVFVNNSLTPLTTLDTNLFAAGSVGLYDFSPTSGTSTPRGQTFDNVFITNLVTIPEPGTLAILSLGLAGLSYVRRKGLKL